MLEAEQKRETKQRYNLCSAVDCHGNEQKRQGAAAVRGHIYRAVLKHYHEWKNCNGLISSITAFMQSYFSVCDWQQFQQQCQLYR